MALRLDPSADCAEGPTTADRPTDQRQEVEGRAGDGRHPPGGGPTQAMPSKKTGGGGAGGTRRKRPPPRGEATGKRRPVAGTGRGTHDGPNDHDQITNRKVVNPRAIQYKSL